MVSLVSGTPHSGRIDQIVYQDSGSGQHLLGNDGVGPVATSLTLNDLASWDKVLRKRLPDDSYGHPSTCYLVYKGQRALLYRDQHGQNRASGFAHVLVSAPANLPPDTALGAWRWHWPGAITPTNVKQKVDPAYGGRLDPLTHDDASGLAGTAKQELSSLVSVALRARAAHRAIIQVLRQPGLAECRFAIVAEPGEQRVQILAGLLWLDGGFLADGFSTHELRYDDQQQGLPRFILTSPGQRHSSFPVSRVKVDLSRDSLASDEVVARAATILTAAYREAADSPAENVATLLAGRPARGVNDDQSRWLRHFLDQDPIPGHRPLRLPAELTARSATETAVGAAAITESGLDRDPEGDETGDSATGGVFMTTDRPYEGPTAEDISHPSSPDRILIEIIAFTLAMKTVPQDARIQLHTWASHQGAPDGDAVSFRDCLRDHRFRPEFIPQQIPNTESYELADHTVEKLTDIAYPGLPGRVFPKPPGQAPPVDANQLPVIAPNEQVPSGETTVHPGSRVLLPPNPIPKRGEAAHRGKPADSGAVSGQPGRSAQRTVPGTRETAAWVFVLLAISFLSLIAALLWLGGT
jgi:hypothetical protein